MLKVDQRRDLAIADAEDIAAFEERAGEPLIRYPGFNIV